MIPDRLHDGDVVKISDNCWAEYVSTPMPEGEHRRALRLTNRIGSGVCIEGSDQFSLLMGLLQRI